MPHAVLPYSWSFHASLYLYKYSPLASTLPPVTRMCREWGRCLLSLKHTASLQTSALALLGAMEMIKPDVIHSVWWAPSLHLSVTDGWGIFESFYVWPKLDRFSFKKRIAFPPSLSDLWSFLCIRGPGCSGSACQDSQLYYLFPCLWPGWSLFLAHRKICNSC